MKLTDLVPAKLAGNSMENKIALVSAGAAAGIAVSRATNNNQKTGAIIGAGLCLLAVALLKKK